MKILGIEKIYEETFKQNIAQLVNVEDSCEIYFNSKMFQDTIDNKVISSNYNQVEDIMILEVEMYINLPLLDRINEIVLCNYYKQIKYIAIYIHAKLVEEYVYILD